MLTSGSPAFSLCHQLSVSPSICDSFHLYRELLRCLCVFAVPVHPHIYSNGDICLNLLGGEWHPSLSAVKLCLAILSMLLSSKSKRPPQDDFLRKSSLYVPLITCSVSLSFYQPVCFPLAVSLSPPRSLSLYLILEILEFGCLQLFQVVA